ncbi:DUF4345 domain-containing protein [Roseibium sp. MMSF_3544]|uniref:DUF4345 domain-containing protein n=1 Tax=unclassified Roseibium TaxID=2629323 RepID=UPI00273EF38F|nr:DUF4345 domain-containing protein [Roseibium sp. MMSF_3544]
MAHTLKRLFIGLAGAIAIGIGATITFAPHLFYAQYGIALPTGPDLISELRAPGANLAVLGVWIMIGAFRSAWTQQALLLGSTVFLAYAAGRAISIVFDGMPSDALFQAMLIEIVIGGIFAALLLGQNRQAKDPVPLESRT